MSTYYSLRVEKIVRETSEAISIYFENPVSQKITYQAGQFLTLLVSVQGKNERRSYSMSSSPLTDTPLIVTVKRIAGGVVSNYLNDTLKVGDTLQVMPPSGRFVFVPDVEAKRHLVLIGAGSGITPLMSILKTALHGEPATDITLIYGNRHQQSVIFMQELEALQKMYVGRLRVIHVLSQPYAGWNGHTGRLNQSVVLKILETLPPATNKDYYLCGPDGMMTEVKKSLQILHVLPEQIHSESFVTTTEETHGEVTEAPLTAAHEQRVTVMYEGAEYTFVVPTQKTILQAALDNDIDLPYSCQSGLCTACMGKCINGKVQMDEEDGLSASEIKAGYVLTCVAHPLTADVVIEI